MTNSPSSTDTAHQPANQTPTRSRHSSVVRTVAILAVATVGLVVFIAGLGDVRRRDWAMAQSRWYASTLADRLAKDHTWPIDLSADSDKEKTRTPPAKMYKFHWVSPAQAKQLAETPGPVLIAWTQLVQQTVWPDGRGCVIFEANLFEAIWLSDREFQKRLAKQQSNSK